MAKDPIKKAENGTYYFRANLGFHPITGKQIQKYKSGFKTKKEAREAYSKLMLTSTEELTEKKQQLSFQQFIEETCNGVQREHNKKLNNGLPILHKVPPKRDYGRYFCIMAEKGGTSHGGLTEKLSPFFHAKKQEVNAYGR